MSDPALAQRQTQLKHAEQIPLRGAGSSDVAADLVRPHDSTRAGRILWRSPVLASNRRDDAEARFVKKIPPELRRKRTQFSEIPRWHVRTVARLREDSQFLRSTVQLTFALLCIWIGIEFHLFVRWGQAAGAESFVARPPGVEGFLPISALISLATWIQTGVINTVHPSGLFILIAIVALALLLKKAFCGWMCPVGTLSEALWMLGQKLFRRNITLPRFLDYPLRTIKYLLLLFFLSAVVQMSTTDLQAFIESPYNKMADVKMYLFFAEMSSFALWTILGLMVLSVLIKNFWCRYLCPYGALLGAISLLSPLKITRNAVTCIDCKLCTRACPSNIAVHKATRVWSDECMSCLQCAEACPVKNTLDLRLRKGTRAVPNWVFAALATGVFVATTGLAMLTGHWQNRISQQEYLRRFQQIDSPVYQHHQGRVPAYGPND
jgi:polyferredoxin